MEKIPCAPLTHNLTRFSSFSSPSKISFKLSTNFFLFISILSQFSPFTWKLSFYGSNKPFAHSVRVILPKTHVRTVKAMCALSRLMLN